MLSTFFVFPFPAKNPIIKRILCQGKVHILYYRHRNYWPNFLALAASCVRAPKSHLRCWRTVTVTRFAWLTRTSSTDLHSKLLQSLRRNRNSQSLGKKVRFNKKVKHFVFVVFSEHLLTSSNFFYRCFAFSGSPDDLVPGRSSKQ